MAMVLKFSVYASHNESLLILVNFCPQKQQYCEIVICLVIFACEHAKSTMPSQINCILGMHVINNEYMIPIVWGEVNCHNEVNSGVTLENQ